MQLVLTALCEGDAKVYPLDSVIYIYIVDPHIDIKSVKWITYALPHHISVHAPLHLHVHH